MAISWPSINQSAFQETSSVPDFQKAFQSGLDTYIKTQQAKYAPKKAEAELQNIQSQIQQRGALNDIRRQLYEAQIQQARQKANTPFGGMLAGTAKEAYALEQLKNQYGEDSRIYKDARRAYEANTASKEALSGYRGALSKTAEQRALTSFGKLQHEEEDVLAGFEPGTNRQHKISPERKDELLGQYALQRQKLSTDADARKKNLLASNIDKTIESINVKDLTRFAGVDGAIKLRQEEAKAATNPGSESENYRKYKDMENKANLLAKQVRQFYGDSIQPAMLKKLEKLTNPATWRNNPDIATRQYNSFIDLLKKETSTYRSAMRNTDVYTGKSESSEKILSFNPQTGRLE